MKLAIAGWIMCGILAYGIFLAAYEAEPRVLSCRQNAGFAAVEGLLGPIGLGVGLLVTGFAEHGLKFSCGTERPN